MPVAVPTYQNGRWGVASFTDGTFTPATTSRMALRREIERRAKEDPIDGYELAVQAKDWDAAARIKKLYPAAFYNEKEILHGSRIS